MIYKSRVSINCCRVIKWKTNYITLSEHCRNSVGTVPNLISKVAERSKSIPITQIYMIAHFPVLTQAIQKKGRRQTIAKAQSIPSLHNDAVMQMVFPHTSEMRLCKCFPHEGFSVPFVSFMHFVWHIRRRRGYPLWHNPTYSHLSERSFRSFMWHCCYFSI